MNQNQHHRQLENKSVVVTGAGRGIGKGIARELAHRGASVLIADRDAKALAQSVAELVDAGYSVSAESVDLLDPDAGERIVASALEAFGHLDALVNNAQASCGAVPLVDQTDDDWELAFGSGPRATFHLMKAAYPHFKKQGHGSIVNFGSGAGAEGLPLFATYGAAKEAIRGLTKVASAEWGPDNIRVNTICPAAMTEGMASYIEAQPGVLEAMTAQVPLGRIGDAVEDIAPAVAFLISEDSAYISGVTIFVDGGSGRFR